MYGQLKRLQATKDLCSLSQFNHKLAELHLGQCERWSRGILQCSGYPTCIHVKNAIPWRHQNKHR
jgi:hypothetical protein